MVVDDEEARCPICLEGFAANRDARKMPCRHENNPAAAGAVQREDEGERRGQRAEEEEEQENQGR
ncbi:hypothetical protein EJ110_NYTH11000 [Nymphaea thermarum]|nr:hypothetical protein EJ110_NYTH11000 [Nymphaea thermarum]